MGVGQALELTQGAIMQALAAHHRALVARTIGAATPPEARLLAVRGKDGAGKGTLLKLLAEEAKAAGWPVSLSAVPAAGWTSRRS
jgi:ABC-type hemin transport system ATPase subunit